MSELRNSITAAERAPWAKRSGQHVSVADKNIDYSYDNGFDERWENAAGTGSIAGISVGNDDRVYVAGSPRQPLRFPAHYLQPLNAKLATQAFFIAPFDCYVEEALEIHAVAGNDASAVTATITRDTAGQVAGAGTAILNGTFDLKGTANTLQTLAPVALYPDRRALVKRGERLSIKFTGNLQTLSEVAVYVWLSPARPVVQYYVQPNADLADQPIYVANRPVRVKSIWVSIGTIGSDAGAVTLDVKKAGSGTAISGGTSVLSATANLKSSALVNTPTALGLAAAATLALAAGDALGIDFTGTLTAVTDVLVTVELEADYQDVIDVSVPIGPMAQHVDRVLFLNSGRAFRALAFSVSHATANGGALTLAFEIESGTTAPAAGAVALHSSTVDMNATANTPQNLDANAPYRTSLIPRLSRISAEFSAGGTSIANSALTMTLQGA